MGVWATFSLNMIHDLCQTPEKFKNSSLIIITKWGNHFELELCLQHNNMLGGLAEA